MHLLLLRPIYGKGSEGPQQSQRQPLFQLLGTIYLKTKMHICYICIRALDLTHAFFFFLVVGPKLFYSVGLSPFQLLHSFSLLFHKTP